MRASDDQRRTATPAVRRRLVLAAVLLASVASYANSLANGFVWDDRKLIVDDRAIKSWSSLDEIFTHDFFARNEDDLPYGYYRPLTTVSYLADYSVWRMNPFGYHLTNVILHCSCTVLAVLLLLQLEWPLAAAAVAGLLFAVHPIHTENVAWIAGRTDLLAFLFAVAAVLLDLSAKARPPLQRRLLRLGSLIAFACALLSKEMGIVTLAWLVLVHRFNAHESWRAVAARLAPYVAVVAVYGIWRLWVIQVPLPGTLPGYSWTTVLLSLAPTIVCYLQWLILPLHLNAYVQNPYVTSALDPRLWMALGIVGVLGFLAMIAARRDQRALLALLMLLAAFGPIANISRLAAPLDMGNVMAERFCYFPSFSFVALIGLAAAVGWDRLASRPPLRVAAIVALLVVVVAGALMSARRNRDWNDELTFLTTTLQQSPTATLLWGNLATYHLGKQNLHEASQAIERAAALDPDNYSVLSSRALWYVVSGHPEAAIELQERIAREARGGRAAALNNLAYLYRISGRPDEALALLAPLLDHGGGYADVYFNMAEILRGRGDFESAGREYARALEDRPNDLRIASVYAAFEMEQGHSQRAAEIYHAMLRIYPGDARLLNNLALLRHQEGDTPAALDLLRRAVDSQPEHINARNNYAELLEESGQPTAAATQFEAILTLVPDSEIGQQARQRLFVLRAQSGAADNGRRHPPLPTPAAVVLVTVDTLRADAVSDDTSELPSTPFLQQLARDAVRFDHAYAPSSWTAPSMASLFTGLTPSVHGIVTGLARQGQVVNQDALADSLTTLAEVFQHAGYTTIGVPSNLHLAASLGFAQGFEHYGSPDFKPAPAVNREVEAQLELAFGATWKTAWKQRPTFLWIHYFDPHDPYEPRQPWIERYAPDYDTWRKQLPVGAPVAELRRRLPKPDAETRRRARALYLADTSFFDDSFRQLAEEIGLVDDNVLLIITADHGEELGDHGSWGHAHTLYGELLHIPLIVRWPSVLPRRRVESLASLIDVYPTTIELAGLQAATAVQGLSLGPVLRGEALHGQRPEFAELHPPRPNLRSVEDGKWKLIRVVDRPDRSQLYDLEADPGEQRDVAGDHTDVVAELQSTLDTWSAALPSRPTDAKRVPLQDDSVKERMRALGYLE